jgi:AraC-like DNA-binding protein
MMSAIMVLFGGYGILQSLLLSMYVLTSRLRKATSNLILVALNLFLIFFLADSLYLFLDTSNAVHFNSISLTSLALIGPLTLLYCRVFLNSNYKAGISEFIQLVPPFLPLVYQMNVCRLHLLTIGLYILVYTIAGLIIVSRSASAAPKKRWLYILLSSIATVVLLLSCFSMNYLCIIGISIGFSVMIYLISFLSIRFYKEMLEPVAKKIAPCQKPHDDETHQLFQKVSDEIVSKKLFKDPELTLPKLASLTSIHTHKLSHLINQQSGKGFPEYINSLRLEEARNLLRTSDLKVAAVAFECGFNSLSSFYTHFKKSEGMTPSEFRSLAEVHIEHERDQSE